MGYCFKEGIKYATKDYVILVTANNECKKESIGNIVDKRGSADIIIPYPTNMLGRSLVRRFVSKCYTFILNAITGYELKYYNGTVLHKTDLISSIDIRTNSYAHQSEALIKLINSGKSYIEIGIEIDYQRAHLTKAFKFANIVAVIYFLMRIIVNK